MARPREASKGAGTLVLINKTDFSAASSVNLNNVFSSTYENYRIIINKFTTAANANIGVRLRSGGTDESSGSNFYKQHFQGVYAAGTTFSYGSNGTTSWDNINYLLNTSDNGGSIIEIELTNPFLNITTTGFARCYAYQADTTTRTLRNGGLSHTAQVSYDGISIIPSTSTMTGTIRVYGYRG